MYPEMNLLICQRESHFGTEVTIIFFGISKVIDTFIHQFKSKFYFSIRSIRAKASFIVFWVLCPVSDSEAVLSQKLSQYLLKE